MRVLLSIKPKYAELIFAGKKKFEFRKTIFKDAGVKTVIVYSSSPVQMVIGEFQIESILSDSPENLWERTKKFAGIDRAFFDSYFTDKKVGFAIEIRKPIRYSNPRPLDDYDLVPPQSFAYLR